MNTAIIIPVWNRSTRLKDKSILELNGKPLIRHTINFAKKFDYPIFVYTPDQEIKDLAKDCAIIHRYEEHNIGDYLAKAKYIHEIVNAEMYIMFQCTSPIRDYNVVSSWIERFQGSDSNLGLAVWDNGDKTFSETGSCYMYKEDIFDMDIQGFFDKELMKKAMFFYDWQNIDIDTQEDFNKAEEYFENKNKTICY